MTLAENKNLCEEIEIAIYSDEKLTEEQMNHIENCENCKALLSQMTALKNDLAGLAVPGIKDGEIADKVMENIKKEKVSKPFPKFKITHHLGTAVAVAVILVAALMIKNPADVAKSDEELQSDMVVQRELTDAVFGVPYSNDEQITDESESAVVEMRTMDSVGTTTENEVSDNEEVESTNEPALMMARPNTTQDNTTEYTASSESDSAKFDLYYDASSEQGVDTANPPDESIADNLADEPVKLKFSAGGGGGSSNSVPTTEDAFEEMSLQNLFEGISFGSNLEENIKLANERIFEYLQIENYFKSDDFSTNEEFIMYLETFDPKTIG